MLRVYAKKKYTKEKKHTFALFCFLLSKRKKMRSCARNVYILTKMDAARVKHLSKGCLLDRIQKEYVNSVHHCSTFNEHGFAYDQQLVEVMMLRVRIVLDLVFDQREMPFHVYCGDESVACFLNGKEPYYNVTALPGLHAYVHIFRTTCDVFARMMYQQREDVENEYFEKFYKLIKAL